MEGPARVALDWFLAVRRDDDWLTVWRLSDPEFRLALALAQLWLWQHRDDPDISEAGIGNLAGAYAGPDFQDALYWDEFAEMQLNTYRETWGHRDPETTGVASKPSVIELDYELCLLVRTDGEPKVYTEDTPVVALLFLMHVVDGEWKVANLGSDHRVTPDWPPKFD